MLCARNFVAPVGLTHSFGGFPPIPTHLAIHYTSTSHVARSRCARGLNSWHYGQANPGNLLGTIRGQDGQSATNLNCTKALTHRHLVNSKTPTDCHGPRLRATIPSAFFRGSVGMRATSFMLTAARNVSDDVPNQHNANFKKQNPKVRSTKTFTTTANSTIANGDSSPEMAG